MRLVKNISSEFKRRVFEESYTRIFKCMERVNHDQLWYSPNSSSNSIGNLILHLHGNMRQWMLSTFIGLDDKRLRSIEFEKDQYFKHEELIEMLLALKNEILQFIDSLSQEDLEKEYQVQVYKESGVSILIHVIEHFSYHTGQIALLTKIIDDKDLEFYPYALE